MRNASCYNMTDMQKMGGEERLKEKIKEGLTIVSVVLVALLPFALPWLALGGLLGAFVLDEAYVVKMDDVSQYSRQYFLDRYYYYECYEGGLRESMESDLLVFPDHVPDAAESRLESRIRVNSFCSGSYILLESKLTPTQMVGETLRLQNLSKTIRNDLIWEADEPQEYVASVRYDSDSYCYPAYIAIDGRGGIYEYALIDRDGGRIIYVYMAYFHAGKFPYHDYLKKDLSAYPAEASQYDDGFSVYQHTFDNDGYSYPFDDWYNEEKLVTRSGTMGFMARLALVYAALTVASCVAFVRKKKAVGFALVGLMLVGIVVLGSLWVLFPM